MRVIATPEALTNQDIYTAPLAVLTTTPSATVATRCAVHVSLSALDAAGGTFLLTVTVGGVAIQPSPMAVACAASATAIIQREFVCPANAQVIVSVQSPNSGDSAGVGITAILYDTTPLQADMAGRTVVVEPVTRWADIVLADGGMTMTIDSATGGFTDAMVGRYIYLEHAAGIGIALIESCESTNQLLAYYPDVFFNAIFADPEEPVSLTGAMGVLGGRVMLNETTHRPQDVAATSAQALIAARLLGTIAAGTHTAQTGDNYPIVSTGASLVDVRDVTDKLNTMLEEAGAAYRFTEAALAEGPAGEGGGGTASDIWSYVARTLTSSSSTVGPTAGTEAADIYTTAHKNGTRRLDARVRNWDGDDILRADISSIAYTAYLLDASNPDTRTAITGHSAVSVTVADVIFDTLQTDGYSSDYNLSHTPPIGTTNLFTIAGRDYLIEYTITPTSGEKIIVRFRVACK